MKQALLWQGWEVVPGHEKSQETALEAGISPRGS